MEKLISEILKEESIGEKDAPFLVEVARDRVRENYKNVKRWTKRIDIFEKKVLVIPINAFKHWFSVIVLNPQALLEGNQGKNTGECEIIYCDSMMEQREFIVEAIRKYLQF